MPTNEDDFDAAERRAAARREASTDTPDPAPISTAAEDFATDPVDQADLAPPAASEAPTAHAAPEDGPKAVEPVASPADPYAVSYGAFPEAYPEAPHDAQSRFSPAARPCKAGP